MAEVPLMSEDIARLDVSGFLEEADRGDVLLPEPCRIVHVDGSESQGVFVSYDMKEACVRFLSGGSSEPQRIPLSGMRMVKLLRPVTLGGVAEPWLARDIAVHAVGRRVPFSVSFRGGHTLSGELLGYCFIPGGLGIYLAGEKDAATRCFIPDHVIEDVVIGLPLGRILLEHGHLSEADLERALLRQRELRSQRVGQILTDRRVISREALESALKLQRGRMHVRIGEILIEMGVITEEQLHAALEEQRLCKTKPLGSILIEMGLLDSKLVRDALSLKLGIPHVDLMRFQIDRHAVEQVPRLVILKHHVMPLCRHGNALVVAMSNPFDARALSALSFAAQVKIIPVLADAAEINVAIEKNRSDGVTLWHHEHEGDYVKYQN